MRKTLSVIIIVLLAFPAFAQDDFGFGGGDSVLTGSDIDALLGGGRGNQRNNNNQNSIPNPEQLTLTLKDLLKAKKVPLSKDQEKTLLKFLDTETVTMRTELEAQIGNRGNNNNNNRGNEANVIGEFFILVTKHNAELLTSMKADLTPDQTSLITKAEKDSKKVCTVLLDQFNPQQLQQGRGGGDRGGGGGRGGGNNNGGNFNFPAGLEDLGFDPRQAANNGGRGGNNNNNNFFQQMPDRAFCTTSASTTAERLAVVSQLLTKGKKPLTPDQEKKFSGLIEARIPLLQEEMKAKDPRIAQLINQINNQNQNQNRGNNNNQAAPAVNLQTLRNNIVNTIMTNLGIPNNNNNNNNNNNRGNRGGNNNANGNTPNANNATANNAAANNTATAPTATAPAATAPAATANNAPANNAANANANATTANANNFPNFNNNNNNNGGGRGGRGNNNQNFNLQAELQRRNEELLDKVAASLNPDQGPVVKKYKVDQIKSKGGAEKYRGIMLQEGTPLTPEQMTQIQDLFNRNNQLTRQAAEQLVQADLAAAPAGSFELTPQAAAQLQPNGSRPNPNNVPQNPAAQKVVAKLMPEVSKRHYTLERNLEDTIMKTLTPPQVASYKLNKMAQ